MQKKPQTNPGSGCCCGGDRAASLPPEMRSMRQPRESSLRKVTCPGCGLVYRTNRPTDVCMECEKKNE